MLRQITLSLIIIKNLYTPSIKMNSRIISGIEINYIKTGCCAKTRKTHKENMFQSKNIPLDGMRARIPINPIVYTLGLGTRSKISFAST
jgi:hypothetical protein